MPRAVGVPEAEALDAYGPVRVCWRCTDLDRPGDAVEGARVARRAEGPGTGSARQEAEDVPAVAVVEARDLYGPGGRRDLCRQVDIDEGVAVAGSVEDDLHGAVRDRCGRADVPRSRRGGGVAVVHVVDRHHVLLASVRQIEPLDLGHELGQTRRVPHERRLDPGQEADRHRSELGVGSAASPGQVLGHQLTAGRVRQDTPDRRPCSEVHALQPFGDVHAGSVPLLFQRGIESSNSCV